MKNLLHFLLETGKLKGKIRRGWQIHQIKNPETTAEHIFHLAILVWALGKNKKINLERAIKIALIHDLCEIYGPELTPYDPLPKNKKRIREILKSGHAFTLALKKERSLRNYQRESKGLNKLISKLPPDLKNEVKNLWEDFEKGLTKEGRFVRQANKVESYLQGLEYWKKYGKIQHHLWSRWIKEIIDDPDLLEFVDVLEKKFYRGCKKIKRK